MAQSVAEVLAYCCMEGWAGGGVCVFWNCAKEKLAVLENRAGAGERGKEGGSENLGCEGHRGEGWMLCCWRLGGGGRVGKERDDEEGDGVGGGGNRGKPYGVRRRTLT